MGKLGKHKLEDDELMRFLKTEIDENINSLELIKSREFSDAFLVKINKQRIFRVNSNMEFFQKDKYAGDNFSSEKIKIPKTLKIGKFNNHIYSITEKGEGWMILVIVS